MTDNELLEFSAKAAGIEVVRSRLDDPLCLDFLVVDSFRNPHQRSGQWNPLTDDGDALRLAVKLGIDVFPWQDKHHDRDDLYGAARRAIVTAAAEIGKRNGRQT